MIKSYQQEQQLTQRKIQKYDFAKITAIFENGIQLIFEGRDLPSKKLYECNCSVKFNVGDKVKVSKIGGSYLVEYPVGRPIL